ncbi:MAG TPA: DUF2442 domain-containing protein [Planctomycetota bacterium]|nr:DUF2442 domain-containing protein [Planctomycetota bacterium]
MKGPAPRHCIRKVSRIAAVRHLRQYRLQLTFSDGTRAELDLRHRVTGRGGVFEPLEKIAYFRRVEVDPEFGTLVWPNGVDFCPDVLYCEATGSPLPVLEPAASES